MFALVVLVLEGTLLVPNCYPMKKERCRNQVGVEEASGGVVASVGVGSHEADQVFDHPVDSADPSADPVQVQDDSVESVGLPPFRSLSPPNFSWGGLSGGDSVRWINSCYAKAVYWIPNLFKLPSGKQGKLFVRELTRLFRQYSEESAMECVALKAAFSNACSTEASQ